MGDFQRMSIVERVLLLRNSPTLPQFMQALNEAIADVEDYGSDDTGHRDDLYEIRAILTGWYDE